MSAVYDRTGEKATDLKALLIRVPADLDEALRRRAATEDRGLAQLVRQALRLYLQEPSTE